MNSKQIRPLALCVFRDGNRILVSGGYDSVKRETYDRPVGGGLEFGETGAAAVTREIREELGVAITGLRLLGALENIFTLEGVTGHEIVLVYDARFVEESCYAEVRLPFREDDRAQSYAHWRDLNQHLPDRPLYPAGLRELLVNSQESQ